MQLDASGLSVLGVPSLQSAGQRRWHLHSDGCWHRAIHAQLTRAKAKNLKLPLDTNKIVFLTALEAFSLAGRQAGRQLRGRFTQKASTHLPLVLRTFPNTLRKPSIAFRLAVAAVLHGMLARPVEKA